MISIVDKNYEAWLREAYRTAALSPDPSTQNGAVIITTNGRYASIACNTFPDGIIQTTGRLEHPHKYHFVEHAERAAIYRLAFGGHRMAGFTLVCPFVACSDCARAIIQSGITTVIGHKQMMGRTPDRWRESIDIGLSMLREAGVTVHFHDGPVPGAPTIRMNGEEFRPW